MAEAFAMIKDTEAGTWIRAIVADAEGELDIYRESPLRYMCDSNEVGEAFAAFLPGWGVPASYGVAGE